MKKNSKLDVQNIISAIENGDVDRNSLKILLIEIRDYLPKNSIIKELSHFIAHPKRDKGAAFSHLQTFVDDFIKCAKYGGEFTVKGVYNKEKVIENLISELQRLGFSVDENLLKKNSTLIINCISEIIDDTEIDINNKDIIEAKILHQKVENEKQLCFIFKPKDMAGKGLRLYSNVDIGFSFFDED